MLGLFLVWPFGALLAAVHKYRQRSSQLGVVLFCGFYGLTLMTTDSSFDTARYKSKFLATAERPFSDLWSILGNLYTEQADATDPFLSVLIFVVSRITNNPAWLFATFGLVFGCFYAKNIWALIDLTKPRANWYALAYVAAFALIIPVAQINGFRMWTAAHIFFYGAFQVVVHKQHRQIWYAVLAVLVHFSFLLPLGVLATYVVLGRRDSIYIPLAIVSIFASEFSLENVLGYAGLFGGAIEERVLGYTSDAMFDRVAASRADSAWFILWKSKILVYTSSILLGLGYFKYRNAGDDRLAGLFSFSVLFLAVINFVGFIPSMGRFITVWLLFMMTYLVLLSQLRGRSIRPIHALAVAPILLYIVVEVRIGLEWTGSLAVIGNVFIALFFPGDTSLLDLIK
jgi:hypothetical protein